MRRAVETLGDAAERRRRPLRRLSAGRPLARAADDAILRGAGLSRK